MKLLTYIAGLIMLAILLIGAGLFLVGVTIGEKIENMNANLN